MEAKNLRLHNWVLCNGLRTKVNISLLKAVFEKNIQETVEPLPLTKEWLDKFGFDDVPQAYLVGRKISKALTATHNF